MCSKNTFADVLGAYSYLTPYRSDGTINGIYSEQYNRICLLYNPSTSGATEIHELAHFLDNIYNISSSEEFFKPYNLYAADYESQSTVVDYAITGGIKEFLLFW